MCSYVKKFSKGLVRLSLMILRLLDLTWEFQATAELTRGGLTIVNRTHNMCDKNLNEMRQAVQAIEGIKGCNMQEVWY